MYRLRSTPADSAAKDIKMGKNRIRLVSNIYILQRNYAETKKLRNATLNREKTIHCQRKHRKKAMLQRNLHLICAAKAHPNNSKHSTAVLWQKLTIALFFRV